MKSDHPPIKWVRREGLRNTGARTATKKRVFVAEGKLYPRLTLSIHLWEEWPSPYQMGGYSIGAGLKEGPKRWWTDCHIPPELMPHLIEMLLEISPCLTPTSSGS